MLIFILFSFYFVGDGVYGRIFRNTQQTPRVPRVTPEFDAKIKSKTCLLKPQVGPCRGAIQMYYFKPDEKTCEVFPWGGCQGNGNRFDTKDECMDTCLTKPGGRVSKPRYCALSFDYGFCFGAVTRYYYDMKWQVCKETLYSGCGGNKNNFYNLAQCENICRFGLGPIAVKGSGTGSREILIINPTSTKEPTTQRTIPTFHVTDKTATTPAA